MSETIQNTLKCTPRQVNKFLMNILEARRVPFIKSSPGMGKSQLVHAIAKAFDLELIDHRLSTSPPEDLSGLPRFVNNVSTFVPFDIFPTRGTPIPKGKNGWLLFLDEFNSADKRTQAAAYKLILDRMTGQHKLHDDVYIVCAGNLATDRAIVNQISTAMQSRVIHLNMILNFDEFMEDVAIPKLWDPRIIAFLNQGKLPKLMDFRPDHQDETFCCPRTWEFMHDLIKGRKFEFRKNSDDTWYYEMEEYTPLYAGTITSGVATEFVQFTKVEKDLPKLRDILSDPNGTEVPHSPPVRYLLSTHLIESVEEKTYEDIATYMDRFPAEFRIQFNRSLLVRHPKLRHHPIYAKSMLELSKYLNKGIV